MDIETIEKNIAALRAGIAQNARDPAHPPMLLPVTKNQTVQAIQALKGAGLTAIGENRVQELMEKYPDLSSNFSFHLIGRLQTNKIKYIIGRVCMLHALDRPALAQALDRHAEAAGVRIPVLIEVNIGAEPQKAGISPGEVREFVRDVAKLSGLLVCGLMAVMPVAENPETLRPLFRQMRVLFDQVQQDAVAETSVTELSMGMSGDWQIAAQEGATILRIGSAIFGDRSIAR